MMKFLNLRLVLGVLMAVPNVYAAEDAKDSSALTAAKPVLFANSQSTDPVTFTMKELLGCDLDGEGKGDFLYKAFRKPFEKTYGYEVFDKIGINYPEKRITLFGLTVGELCLVGDEYVVPYTLNTKVVEIIKNQENKEQIEALLIPKNKTDINNQNKKPLVTKNENVQKLNIELEVVGDTGEKPTLISEESRLFADSQPTDPVIFTMKELLEYKDSAGIDKASVLYRAFMEYFETSVIDFNEEKPITLPGFTVSDLHSGEGGCLDKMLELGLDDQFKAQFSDKTNVSNAENKEPLEIKSESTNELNIKLESVKPSEKESTEHDLKGEQKIAQQLDYIKGLKTENEFLKFENEVLKTRLQEFEQKIAQFSLGIEKLNEKY